MHLVHEFIVDCQAAGDRPTSWTTHYKLHNLQTCTHIHTPPKRPLEVYARTIRPHHTAGTAVVVSGTCFSVCVCVRESSTSFSCQANRETTHVVGIALLLAPAQGRLHLTWGAKPSTPEQRGLVILIVRGTRNVRHHTKSFVHLKPRASSSLQFQITTTALKCDRCTTRTYVHFHFVQFPENFLRQPVHHPPTTNECCYELSICEWRPLACVTCGSR